MGTNTGDAGFSIDGKLYDFELTDPSSDGTIVHKQRDNGDVKVDDSKKDISKDTRVKLSQYLSQQTIGNDYPVDGKYREVTLTVDGKPIDLPTEPTNDPQYTTFEDASGTVMTIPSEALPTGPAGSSKPLLDPASTLYSLSKGRQTPQNTNGNTLLKDVDKNQLGTVIAPYTNIVLQNNRFTPKMYEDLKAAGITQVGQGGSYRIRGREYSGNQLKQLGAMLSLRASQEFPAAFQDNVNPVDSASVAGALLPSPNQVGATKIDISILEAAAALSDISDNDSSPIETSAMPINGQSWGALNNVEEQWSGVFNVGMISMALALQITLLLTFEGLGALISLADATSTTPAPSRRKDGTYVLGQYLANRLSDPSNVGNPPDVKALLGIRGTRYPFGDALRVGASALFVGPDKAKADVGQQLATAAQNASTGALTNNANAGFLILISRSIIRTAQVVAAHVDKISRAFAANPVSGIEEVGGLFDVLRQSKLISAVNIFTSLGDAILSEDSYAIVERGVPSHVDVVKNDAPGASAIKNRLRSDGTWAADQAINTTKIAWAANRAPSMYLLPDSVSTMAMADGLLGVFKGPIVSDDVYSRTRHIVQKSDDRKENGARISQENVDAMEKMLDAEYVPFYFHDIRTNEIVSFHAFLTQLTDTFSPSWESVEGFGRGDNVRIYKGTGRKISLGFYIAALDEKDFDEMWVKVNKLVTLVYPQYTKGRTLTDGDQNTFVQPFSQLMSASPLVRLRLGDLIRSNYSRFALARLFGAADDDMKVGGAEVKFTGAADGVLSEPDAAFRAAALLNKAISRNGEFTLAVADWPSATIAEGTDKPKPQPNGPKKPDQADTMVIKAEDLPYFKFVAKKQLSNGQIAVEPKLRTSDEMGDMGVPEYVVNERLNTLQAKYGSTEHVNTRVIGGVSGYAVPWYVLRMTPKTLKQILNEESGANASKSSIDVLTEFMDFEKNALVKSFRSVGGKGLAVTIDDLTFDWYDKVTWDTRVDQSRRAPKMCKVTLSVTPIHDIAPGIDHLGYNRAPVYPVGSMMGHRRDVKKKG